MHRRWIFAADELPNGVTRSYVGPMHLPIEPICGFPPLEIRDLIRAFLAMPRPASDLAELMERRRPPAKRMSATFVAQQLGIDQAQASALLQALGDEGYIDPHAGTPTPKGMALSHVEDRPPLTRSQADELVQRVCAWAAAVDQDRVWVDSIFVFGSYLGDAPEINDLDLLVTFRKPDFDDLQPEDDERADILADELSSISEYISPQEEFGISGLEIRPKMRRIYPKQE